MSSKRWRISVLMYVCLFLFKQKTAYESRISDWSSDVCSSDLRQMATKRAPELLPTPFCFSSADCGCPVSPPNGRRGAPRCERETARASCRDRVCQYV